MQKRKGHSIKTPWRVIPDLASGNAYRLWDGDDNYPADTSVEAMEVNAKLMQAAPELLEALQAMVNCRGRAAAAEHDAAEKKASSVLAKIAA